MINIKIMIINVDYNKSNDNNHDNFKRFVNFLSNYGITLIYSTKNK